VAKIIYLASYRGTGPARPTKPPHTLREYPRGTRKGHLIAIAIGMAIGLVLALITRGAPFIHPLF
jgi:hypothetical protein